MQTRPPLASASRRHILIFFSTAVFLCAPIPILGSASVKGESSLSRIAKYNTEFSYPYLIHTAVPDCAGLLKGSGFCEIPKSPASPRSRSPAKTAVVIWNSLRECRL
ncbi:hypothetical protein B0H14DRAFT_2774439 [Mycena olivaceomarginata]|nr:hypothetical protein B0H14DRAFT_2774439 [Mycena olivaceomarginata]